MIKSKVYLYLTQLFNFDSNYHNKASHVKGITAHLSNSLQ